MNSVVIQHIDYIDEPELVFGSGQKLAIGFATKICRICALICAFAQGRQ